MTERGHIDDAAKDKLIDWYSVSHRQLPWRETRDPYRILVSEIMLQQTQADRVVPKYHEFLERFPTIHALADAPASEVIRAWAGLGYNRRALNLQRACRAVVDEHGGVMPSDPALLERLPGIGPYTAGAVACFAYERDVGFVDTNIRRVIRRVVAGPDVPEPSMTTRETDRCAASLVPPGRGYVWNQALIELGAMICRARSTDCPACPLQDNCRARPVIQPLLAQYIRQPRTASPKFETTSRFVRGRVVAALREAPTGLTVRDLDKAVWPDSLGADEGRIGPHLAGLVRDGLIVPTSGLMAVREDAPAYEAGASFVDLDMRYRLPD